MQKLVIDTNVFISYLISKKGFAFKITSEIFLSKKALHYVSDDTLTEYLEVLGRTRFAKKYPEFSKAAYQLFTDIIELSVLMHPQVSFNMISDESDNRFLEIAHTADADYLITGNILHFTFSSFYKTQIVSPREYWEFCKPSN